MSELSTTIFNYEQLDVDTADFLKAKEDNMRNITKKAVTDLGRELKEAQDELSKKGYGCFEQWYEVLGYHRTTVYKIISRYELILHNVEEQKLIEEIPLSLSYEIAKPNVDEILKQLVLDGKVKTLKEYKELLKQQTAQNIRDWE